MFHSLHARRHIQLSTTIILEWQQHQQQQKEASIMSFDGQFKVFHWKYSIYISYVFIQVSYIKVFDVTIHLYFPVVCFFHFFHFVRLFVCVLFSVHFCIVAIARSSTGTVLVTRGVYFLLRGFTFILSFSFFLHWIQFFLFFQNTPYLLCVFLFSCWLFFQCISTFMLFFWISYYYFICVRGARPFCFRCNLKVYEWLFFLLLFTIQLNNSMLGLFLVECCYLISEINDKKHCFFVKIVVHLNLLDKLVISAEILTKVDVFSSFSFKNKTEFG